VHRDIWLHKAYICNNLVRFGIDDSCLEVPISVLTTRHHVVEMLHLSNSYSMVSPLCFKPELTFWGEGGGVQPRSNCALVKRCHSWSIAREIIDRRSLGLKT
jgi:hypothetical protein